jgi:hypothetical protein
MPSLAYSLPFACLQFVLSATCAFMPFLRNLQLALQEATSSYSKEYNAVIDQSLVDVELSNSTL